MNIMGKQCRYFSVPQELVRSGLLETLSGSAVKLYMILLELAQKHSAVKIELVGYEIEDYGIHANSVKAARDDLVAAGLVQCERRLHGIIEYQLMNPETKRPLDPPDGRKGIRRYRPRDGRSERRVKQIKKATRDLERKRNDDADDFYPPSWDEIARDPSGEPGEAEPV